MSEPIESPVIAILIVNFRRAADTVECLDSLLRIDHPSFDIILADNGSGDAEVAVLQEYAHRHGEHIRLISFPTNYGFTGAHNRIFADIIPTGKYEFILLLNNDTVADPDFLTRMLAKIDTDNHTEMVAARMMKYSDRTCIDSLGITFYKCGLASNRKSPDDPLLGPCGGCALYTTALLRQVYRATGEYFDDDFFCYAEDTDLAWRAVLLGYCAAYADDALVYHKGSIASGGPNSDFVLYHGIRNSLLTLIKDLPAWFLWCNLFWTLALHGAILLRYTVKGKLGVVFRLYQDFFKKIPVMLHKRNRLLKVAPARNINMRLIINPAFYERGYVKQAWSELKTSCPATKPDRT